MKQNNISIIIFDLSEVLISGLFGIEKTISSIFGIDEDKILPAFGGENLDNLCKGLMSENDFIASVINKLNIKASGEEIKNIIRQNFNNKIPGAEQILIQLKKKYKLVLLSDHAREWVSYILSKHQFLIGFDFLFFSFHFTKLKKDSSLFEDVIKLLKVKSVECLFIDDNPVNIKFAETAGLKGIHFTNSEKLKEKLIENGLI